MRTIQITSTTVIQPTYSDLTKDLGEQTSNDISYDVDSINQSVITILTTPVGSRVFNRNFGSYIDGILFDPIDNVTVQRIKTELLTSIGQWEHRIVVQNSVVIPDYTNQLYYVEITYVVPTLNNKVVNFTFNIIT
jgi:phage baseplate assembly protein W